MKAIRIHENGDLDKLIYEDIPVPEPKAGEVRIHVGAIGLNFADIYQRKGLYPLSLPSALGTEFAGTVDALGEGVTAFKVGDRVAAASGRGAYAEYALAPAIGTAKIADHVSIEQAAAVMLQGLTAHYLALSTFPLKSNDTALVHAAAGGVGLLLTQIAKMRGATVIGTVSTDEKADLARKAGADQVIVYTREDFEAETKRITAGKGVDVVYDGVGKTTFDKSLNCLRPRGYLVLFGQSSGPVPPLDPQILNRKGSLYLTRPTLISYLLTREEFAERATDIFTWMSDGRLDVLIDKTFPLADAAAAQGYIESRQSKGKVLLIP